MEYIIKYKIHLKVYRSIIKSNDEATAKYVLLGKASNKFNVSYEDIIIISCEEKQIPNDNYKEMFGDDDIINFFNGIFGNKK